MESKKFTWFQGLLGFCAFLLVALSGTAHAQLQLDPAEVEAWADEYYGRAIAEKRSAGITVSIVQDGDVVLSKGYGYADYAAREPVDAETTCFIVGSITKTFIATSIAQLIDRGVIGSFDDPANKYLTRIQLPGERGAKVTIAHLMNHRAGFADVDFGFMENGGVTPIPMTPEEIYRRMPAIVFEPGGAANYSNWSFTILGVLIEDVTGQRIDEYFEENIFEPLGMDNTSLAYGALPDNLALNYVFEKDGAPIADYPGVPRPWISPAGAIAATAKDMARYMNAHLLAGENGGYPLVSRKMFKELHTERFRNGAIGLGFARTFWTAHINGAQSLEHGGGAPGFQSMMTMIPEYRIGFFVSAMQGGPASWETYSKEEIEAGEDIVGAPPSGFELRESFLKRFFDVQEAYPAGPKSDLSKLTGKYWTQRRPFRTVEILGQAFNPAAVLTVTRSEDGEGLLINGAGPYSEIGAGIFKSPTGEWQWNDPYSMNMFLPPYIEFVFDETGEVAYFLPGLTDQTYAPVSNIFNPQTMLTGFLGFGMLAATGLFLVLWPHSRRFTALTNYLGVAASIAVLAFPYAIFLGFEKGDSLIAQMAVGDKSRLWLMVIAANALIIIAGLMTFLTARNWMAGGEANVAPTGRNLHASLVALSCVALVAVFHFFNLVGVNLPS